MFRLRFVIVLLCTAVLASACGKSPLGEAGLKGESSISVVRDLTSAYERRDIDTFMEKVASSFPDRAAFQKSIENVFAQYQTIHFEPLFNRSIVDVLYKGSIKVTFTWEAEWRTSGGKIVKDGSRVTLALDPSSFKLTAIEGKDPFVPVEAPLPIGQ